MTYVLDTNVVSALRVPGRHPAVAAWADSVQVAEQFVVAITLAEIERGVIAKGTHRPDPGCAPTALVRRQGAAHIRPPDAVL
ncbi:hypothetical protein LRC484719_09530 [Mycobacterium riyadhense]